jgi:prevent-host-death family protein
MEVVGVNVLRKNLTRVLERVKNGESITIVSRGDEVAQLVPPVDKIEKARKALAELRKTAYVGDVVSPIEGDWEMMR